MTGDLEALKRDAAIVAAALVEEGMRVALGLAASLGAAAPAALRRGARPGAEADGVADHLGPFDDPVAVAARLASTARVVDHGLFEPALIDHLLVAAPGRVVRRVLR